MDNKEITIDDINNINDKEKDIIITDEDEYEYDSSKWSEEEIDIAKEQLYLQQETLRLLNIYNKPMSFEEQLKRMSEYIKNAKETKKRCYGNINSLILKNR